ncbi:MAG: hypothetical protein ABIH34_02070 [Nanoarchaeota archaeon]
MRRLITFDSGQPESVHLGITYAHPNILTSGDPGRVLKVRKYLDPPVKTVKNRGFVTVHGFYKRMGVTASSSGIGVASVQATFPELLEACLPADSEEGDPKIFGTRMGSAGANQDFLNVGDFVATTKVDRDEEASSSVMGPHYVAWASPNVYAKLIETANRLKKDGQNVYGGMTRVTDSIYYDALEGKIPKNVFAVSMEMSMYCALRDRFLMDHGIDIDFGNLLFVREASKKTDQGLTDTGNFASLQQMIEDVQIKTCLETLFELREEHNRLLV